MFFFLSSIGQFIFLPYTSNVLDKLFNSSVMISFRSHWTLLIFCNFGEDLDDDNDKTCMLFLDSLKTTETAQRLEPDIRKQVLSLSLFLEWYLVSKHVCSLFFVFQVCVGHIQNRGKKWGLELGWWHPSPCARCNDTISNFGFLDAYISELDFWLVIVSGSTADKWCGMWKLCSILHSSVYRKGLQLQHRQLPMFRKFIIITSQSFFSLLAISLFRFFFFFGLKYAVERGLV